MEEFPERLKRAMKLAGLSSKELAGQMGVSPITVSRWRTGERQPTLKTLAELAEVLGVSLSYLIEGVGSPVPALPAWLRRLATLLDKGVDGKTALDMATRASPKPRQTAAERRLLQAATASLRQDLQEASGGKWGDLSREKQDQILARIAALAERDAPE